MYLPAGTMIGNIEVKGLLSSLRQFLATESPLDLQMVKNVFYFILKALLVLKIFKFLP